mmetsp:Transcript_28246/g.66913  ORF Transcript_28246/g.66913 Transcript_28246/m.66913 type:complete len:203 (-) Transcript_28246:671-1279(-)
MTKVCSPLVAGFSDLVVGSKKSRCQASRALTAASASARCTSPSLLASIKRLLLACSVLRICSSIALLDSSSCRTFSTSPIITSNVSSASWRAFSARSRASLSWRTICSLFVSSESKRSRTSLKYCSRSPVCCFPLLSMWRISSSRCRATKSCCWSSLFTTSLCCSIPCSWLIWSAYLLCRASISFAYRSDESRSFSIHCRLR